MVGRSTMSHEFNKMKRQAWWSLVGHSDIKKATKVHTHTHTPHLKLHPPPNFLPPLLLPIDSIVFPKLSPPPPSPTSTSSSPSQPPNPPQSHHQHHTTPVDHQDATNSENWGPSTEQLKGLAAACYVSEDRAQVLHNIWKRLEETEPKKWQKIVKALVVLDYACLHGPEDVVLDVRRNSFRLKTLREFKHVAGNVDHGESVRTKALNLLDLINSDDRIREARESAKRTSKRITGSSSNTVTVAASSSSSSRPAAQSRGRGRSPGLESTLVPTGLSDEEMARRLQEKYNREAGVAAPPSSSFAAHGHTVVSAADEEDVIEQVMRISKMEAEAALRVREEEAAVAAAATLRTPTSPPDAPRHVAQGASPPSGSPPPPPQQQQPNLFEQATAPAPTSAAAAAPAHFDPFDPFAPSCSPAAPEPKPAVAAAPQSLDDFFAAPAASSPPQGAAAVPATAPAPFDPRGVQQQQPQPAAAPSLQPATATATATAAAPAAAAATPPPTGEAAQLQEQMLALFNNAPASPVAQPPPRLSQMHATMPAPQMPPQMPYPAAGVSAPAQTTNPFLQQQQQPQVCAVCPQHRP